MNEKLPISRTLNRQDLVLVEETKSFLEKNYLPGKHHTASILVGKTRKYYSLHLDTKGFDVCAEPGSINQAILSGEKKFTTIVTAEYVNEQAHIINPCGNCRQIFLTFCPSIEVIINHNDELIKVRASDLLPFPYI